MSGEELRDAAQYGRTDDVRNILKDRGNPCSTDTLGLSALHYATWNGHIECVKYLLANPYGVDSNGIRCSCLDLASVKQYTALHLVAFDCPPWSAKEICHLLLLFGMDRNQLCCDGHTPLAIAKLQENGPVLEAFIEFDTLVESQGQPEVPPVVQHTDDDHDKAAILDDVDFELGNTSSPSTRSRKENARPVGADNLQAKLDKLVKKYRFLHPPVRTMDLDKINKTVRQKYRKHAFPLPTQLEEDRSTWGLPADMQIYEHNLSSAIVEGFVRAEGSQSYKMLDFLEGQATINLQRRDRLVKIAGATKVGMAGVAELEKSKEGRVVLDQNILPGDDADLKRLYASKDRFEAVVVVSPSEKIRDTFQDRLVPKLPHSEYQDRLPWDDDMLQDGDKIFLRNSVLNEFRHQQLKEQGGTK